MPRDARAPTLGSILLTAAQTATGAVTDRAGSPAALAAAGAVSGYFATFTTGFSFVLRDTDGSGTVLLEISGADASIEKVRLDPEFWRTYSAGGLHLTVAGTGSVFFEYRPAA